MDLANKTAVITGGSDGIGFAISETFAKQGADVVIIGRSKDKLEKAAEELEKYNTNVSFIQSDLEEIGSCAQIAEELRQKDIRTDILVNNAGIARFIPFQDSDETVLDYHLNLNIKAPYMLTRALLEDLVNTRGSIINISSYFAKRMLPDRPSTAYSLTKGAVDSFTKALAFELGPKGVRVNAIAPGKVLTKQLEKNLNMLDESAKERFRQIIPMIYPLQKIGEPGDIAEMAAFLASDKAKWITGGIFSVDGGLTTN